MSRGVRLGRGENDVGPAAALVAGGERGHAGLVATRGQGVAAGRDIVEQELAVGAGRGRGDLGAGLVGQGQPGAGERPVSARVENRAGHPARSGQFDVLAGQGALFHGDRGRGRGIGRGRHDQRVVPGGQVGQAERAVAGRRGDAGDLTAAVGHGHDGAADRHARAGHPDHAGQPAATGQHHIVAGGRPGRGHHPGGGLMPGRGGDDQVRTGARGRQPVLAAVIGRSHRHLPPGQVGQGDRRRGDGRAVRGPDLAADDDRAARRPRGRRPVGQRPGGGTTRGRALPVKPISLLINLIHWTHSLP
jgi:hypothetical protein